MSSIGLSTFFPADAAVPSRLILRLTEVNVASLAVACFLFDLVLREARHYWKRAWRHDTWFWRLAVPYMVFCCGADLGLFAAAAGVGLRDLQSGGYSRDTLDYIYIVSKFTLWSSGMLAEAFFVLRVWMIVQDRRLKPIVWVLYFITSAPFATAFCLFLLSKYHDFRYGLPARIMDLIGGWCNLAFAGYTSCILGYRLYEQRKREYRSQDSLIEIFRGALMTSALIAFTSLGGAIAACFVHDPANYMISAFFFNIYPQLAAASCIFALHQRQTLRGRSRYEEGGYGGGVVVRSVRERKESIRTDDPSEWRADRVSMGPKVVEIEEPDMRALRRGSKLGGEVSFYDVALDCEAFERVKPQISRTGTVSVMVHTTVEIEEDEPDERDRDTRFGRERQHEQV
ncbi:hypothetical protein NBRC10512_002230 [Rhodotorula toruloides]|uniref:RHTO0S02e09978g1_1 n=2 Tax=Rhodotorula toruloides TaxID=5286 RepID=A0A061AQP6_RHOTO|nr:uncharacterized protein RHTO_07332 [Rhodotorula toruloides NP11]EMS23598.1 hypothetical protein RHTO_07332 [Rhodotorula toruloides NP11]CDR37031.1 RHTO0S02e09978g1_1 [Rhodotorula toruloides]